jgi:hypothetical protein
MATVRTFCALVTLFIASSSLAHAQTRHIVDDSTIASVVGEHAAAQEAERAAVRAALTRPEVRAVAAKLGLDVDRLSGRVEALNGPQLADAANYVRQLNEPLVGGASTVVISTTAIIIALLIVLIIVIAA